MIEEEAKHRPVRDASPARGLLHHSTGERCTVCELPWPCKTARERAS